MKHPTLDIGYRLFLDPNGYVIGFLALDDYYANYLYVDAVDLSLSTITAKVVFTDGTAKTVEITTAMTATSMRTTTTRIPRITLSATETTPPPSTATRPSSM